MKGGVEGAKGKAVKWRGSGFLFRFLINTVVQEVLLSICTECRGSFTPFSVRLLIDWFATTALRKYS